MILGLDAELSESDAFWYRSIGSVITSIERTPVPSTFCWRQDIRDSRRNCSLCIGITGGFEALLKLSSSPGALARRIPETAPSSAAVHP
jgi:hypothetical protein